MHPRASVAAHLSTDHLVDQALRRDLYTLATMAPGTKPYTTEMAAAGDVLLFMAHKGSSVELNWGEDTDAWECSWITGGTRFVGAANIAPLAICCAFLQGTAPRDVSVEEPADRLMAGAATDQQIAMWIAAGHVRPYSTDAPAATELAKFMARGDGVVELDWWKAAQQWKCSWITGGKQYVAFAETGPLALCRAALKSLAPVGSAT